MVSTAIGKNSGVWKAAALKVWRKRFWINNFLLYT